MVLYFPRFFRIEYWFFLFVPLCLCALIYCYLMTQGFNLVKLNKNALHDNGEKKPKYHGSSRSYRCTALKIQSEQAKTG